MKIIELIQYVIIPLASAIIGAMIAFWYQRKMEIRRDKRNLMQALMGYRTIGAVEIDWIRALNMVDAVFHDNKKVKDLLLVICTTLTQNGTLLDTIRLF